MGLLDKKRDEAVREIQTNRDAQERMPASQRDTVNPKGFTRKIKTRETYRPLGGSRT